MKTAVASVDDVADVMALDRLAHARLGADEVAVELGERDGQAGGHQRRRDHARVGRMVLERDDQRQADDGAVEDTRDLRGGQVLLDRAPHGGHDLRAPGERSSSDRGD